MQTDKKEIRKCAPFLESVVLSGNGALAPDEWRAVPDIWRSSAEKYGDRVALVDPYHDPPSTVTYKQVYYFVFWCWSLFTSLLTHCTHQVMECHMF